MIYQKHNKFGQVSQSVIPNGNTTSYSYFQDGLPKQKTTRKSDQTLLNQHTTTTATAY
ncbi:hypothetical protein IC619_014000 [Hazenella sp. IB182353]|nr:hypothetical protein [Polycladospora coralii]